jgi:hypothetical protein
MWKVYTRPTCASDFFVIIHSVYRQLFSIYILWSNRLVHRVFWQMIYSEIFLEKYVQNLQKMGGFLSKRKKIAEHNEMNGDFLPENH